MSNSTARAIPARFDASSQHRRAMIAKIQIARQQLNMDEDDYRQILFDKTGRMSLKDCTEPQMAAVLDVMKAKGFKPLGKGGKAVAMHPVARKARALWISLYHLGAVRNSSEEALEAFAKRQVGCDKLIWMRQSEGHKLVEALKSMGHRAGWRMHPPGYVGKALSVTELQSNLCWAILRKLQDAGVVPEEWSLHDAAWKLCGIENGKEHGWTASDYDRLAAGLGRKLRELAPAQPVEEPEGQRHG